MIIGDTIRALTERLNLKKVHIKGDELWCLCLNSEHNDRHPTNFSINLVTGKAFCFACQYSTDVISLIHKDFTYSEGIRFWNSIKLERKSLLELPEPPLDKYYVEGIKKNGISEYAKNRLMKVNNEKLIDEVLTKYGVYQDDRHNPLFFIRDDRGLERAVWVRENNRYFLLYPTQSKRDGFLFGQHLPNTEINYLVEGFFDALWVHMITGMKAVCGMGTYLSRAQYQTLEKIQPLYVFFDGDKAGRLARQTFYEKYSRLAYYMGCYNGDPDEMSKERIEQQTNKAKSSVEYNLWRKK